MKYKVDTFFIDFRPAFLEAKIEWMKAKAFDP